MYDMHTLWLLIVVDSKRALSYVCVSAQGHRQMYTTYTLATGKMNSYWQQDDNFRSLAKAIERQQEWEYTYGVVCRIAHIRNY